MHNFRTEEMTENIFTFRQIASLLSASEAANCIYRRQARARYVHVATKKKKKEIER